MEVLIFWCGAGARRKLYSSTVGGAGLGNGLQNASIHVSLAGPKVAPEEDNASDEEVEGGVDWNWREDERCAGRRGWGLRPILRVCKVRALVRNSDLFV